MKAYRRECGGDMGSFENRETIIKLKFEQKWTGYVIGMSIPVYKNLNTK